MRTASLATAITAIAAAVPAAADPVDARVVTAPTAWLLPGGTVAATLGVDHRGDGLALASAGLGGLATVELGGDSDVRACTGCNTAAVVLGRAAFRVGARQDAWFRGMPALVLGVRTTFAVGRGAVRDPQVSHAYAMASRELGVVRVHAGVDVLAAAADDRRTPAVVRPLAALEIHPPMYPRSSLIGDLAWEPVLDAQRGLAPGWLLGIGVRYQAFRWASVELAVRAREREELGASTVMVRLNAVRDLARPR